MVKPSGSKLKDLKTKKRPTVPKSSLPTNSSPFISLLIKSRRARWITLAGCVVVLIVALFLGRGWVRFALIPDAATPVYNHSIQHELTTQNANLLFPYSLLGIRTSPSSTTCSLELAKSIHTQIYCQASLSGYTKLARTISGEATAEKAASGIQSTLGTHGWSAGSNGVTLTSLIDGIYQGKDYSPDAYYEKVTGNYDCTFDTMIAYANPHPPAINSTLMCVRTVNLFGAPPSEFYNSSKGHLGA
jgi:hypothetical protein